MTTARTVARVREGQDRLADRGRVGLLGAAHPGRQPGRVRAGQDVDVDDVGALQHAEVHRVPGGLAQVGHDRPGGVAQAALLRHQLAELEQLQPQAQPPAVPLSRLEPDQLAGQPVRRGLRQRGPPGQLGQGERVVVVAERLEHRGDPPGGGDRAVAAMSRVHGVDDVRPGCV